MHGTGALFMTMARPSARRPTPNVASTPLPRVGEYLVRTEDALALLFAPPFDQTSQDPGYIKGYLPGIRENGGQYTHAAAWSVVAFAMLGLGDKAHELFSMLNPVNHTATRSSMCRYRVEPYVAVADIYSEPPHIGRGGELVYWLIRLALSSGAGVDPGDYRARRDPTP